jgi:Flp pilus assembly protein TadG
VTRRYSTRDVGQSLVEFALILPIFLLVLLGLIDMGRAVYTNNTLSQAAREATRLAAAQASWVGKTTGDDATCNAAAGPVCPADVATLKTNVDAAANRMAVGLGVLPGSQIYMQCNASGSAAPTGAWTGSTCTSRSSGSQVSVRIAYTHTMLTPIVGQIVNNLSMSASATMVIN